MGERMCGPIEDLRNLQHFTMKILQREKVTVTDLLSPPKLLDTWVERLRWGGHASIVGSVTGFDGVAPIRL